MDLPELRRFSLGDLPLSGGGRLRDAVLTYRLWGERDAPAVLLPSYYTGTSASQTGIIGPGRALDPERLLIIATDLFGNGVATSPSHRNGREREAFPGVSVEDNVRAQASLLDALGIGRLALVQGWSLAAIQAWHWAAMFPDRVEAILPVCGATGCWPLNRVFLSGLRAVLEADPDFAGAAPGPGNAPRALRAFGRVYAGWAYSPAFWRDARWRELGFDGAGAVLDWWERDHLLWDAHDLAVALATWEGADLARATGAPDLAAALARVTARVIAMPGETDRYFTPEENALEIAAVARGELRPLRSAFGHCAGAPGRVAADSAEVEKATRALLPA
ncbi:alpha/beta fold hydrolase [Amaricoccus solimangrovi]|uniref:Alpha/beta fold hydrolase n=1 Tax=Amaricoccus solimangrovi TaxID=2589815 RepID=A0A501WKY9_9RHOB|nr:alpha/beta fold hydrolase [Amaricoccus solimangrovi]TPE47721.1 alpha/beta fold hydrolase [Amaricoccus solimangrovi]